MLQHCRVLAILLVLASAGVVSGQSLSRAEVAGGEVYYLSVIINDLYSPDLRVLLPVRIGRPFKVTVENGVRTEISGTVLAPLDDKYPLDLSVAEWVSKEDNLKDTTSLRLELDRSIGFGPVSSFVYRRTVTLSKTRPKDPGER